MPLPLLMAAGMAALQMSGNAEQNKKTGEAFVKNTETVKASYQKQLAQLQEQAESVQKDFALEQTKLRYKGMAHEASTSNKIVEQNISGATAARVYNQSSIDEMMAHNALAKAAEENAVNFGVEMENKRDAANQAIRNGQAIAAKNTISPMQGLSSTASAAMSGYSMGSALGGMGSSSPSGGLNNSNSSYKPTTSANYGTADGAWIGV